MARYTGPQWKISRRLGFSILENGKELNRRAYAPGQHGQKRKKQTEYGLQLAEKQKVRHMYGVNEKQFHNTFNQAGKMEGIHGYNFLCLLSSTSTGRKPCSSAQTSTRTMPAGPTQ